MKQQIFDAELVGHGCKIATLRVRNRVIVVEATVSLRDRAYLDDTTAIDVAIQKAVRSYFDDRADWNVWNVDTLRSVIGRAHTKVYTCTSATVKDAATGETLTEILTPNYAAEQFHYYLASNAMKLSYVGPA